jgi:hypothetical protein
MEFNMKHLRLVGLALATLVGGGLASETKHLFRGLTEESFGGKNDFPQRMAMAAKEADEMTSHLSRKLLAESDHDSLRRLDEVPIPLIAGGGNENGAIPVGRVLISNVGSNLLVKYVIEEASWCLTETHLAVGSSVDDIPHTRKQGIPIPGQFEYSSDHDCVKEYSYTIENWTCAKTIIAAHAVVSTFTYQEVDLAALEASLPDTVQMIPTFPGTGDGPPSYWDIVIADGPLAGSYDGFCVDTDRTMSSGATYTANVYSSYETAAQSLVEYPNNLDLVNYIINQGYIGKAATPCDGSYTYGDVQRAIWELIEDTL